MPPTEVHLIGEYHFDLFAYPRYQRAFSLLQPDTISIETDRERVAAGVESLKLFLEAGYGSYKEAIKHLPSFNFEALVALHGLAGVFAAKSYPLKQNPVTIALIDSLSVQTKGTIEYTFSSPANPTEENENLEDWKGFLEEPNPYEKVLIEALGRDEWIQYSDQGLTIPQALLVGLVRISACANRKQLSETNLIMDRIYHLPINLSNHNFSNFEVQRRDDAMLEQILSQPGKVIHAGGIAHFFGNYHNLYERLKEKGLNVTRHKLIEFEGNNQQP